MEETICKKWNAISITNNVFMKFTVLIRQLSYQNVVLFLNTQNLLVIVSN